MIDEFKSTEGHSLYQCALGQEYISDDGLHSVDRDFERGVIKLQRGELAELTYAERTACTSLKIHSEEVLPASGRPALAVAERIAVGRKRKCSAFGPNYINAGFVLGSIAQVERFWSLCKYVLRPGHDALSPIMSETILYLKINSSYWSPATVSETIALRRSRRVEAEGLEDDDHFAAEV